MLLFNNLPRDYSVQGDNSVLATAIYVLVTVSVSLEV